MIFWSCTLLLVYGTENNRPDNISNDFMKGGYLGPTYNNEEIRKILNNKSYKFNYFEDEQLIKKVADLIASGNVIGWFQGRLEFGPRALGNRSIIGDPRNSKMQSIINQKVKFRESFRPFAPAILKEKCKDWFEFEKESPYMLFVSQIKDEKNKKY